MNYYLFRNFKTKEATYVFATTDFMLLSKYTENITQAEYETYKEFGIPEAETERWRANG